MGTWISHSSASFVMLSSSETSEFLQKPIRLRTRCSQSEVNESRVLEEREEGRTGVGAGGAGKRR